MSVVLPLALLAMGLAAAARHSDPTRHARTRKPGTAAALDAKDCFNLALNASATGNHHACITYLEEVLRQQPANARAIYLMAAQHVELGLRQQGIAGIRTALSIEPDLEIARFELGLLLFDNNEPGEARDCLGRLRGSSNGALRAYAEALIAIADNDPTLARQQLALGQSESSPGPQLSELMNQLLERLSMPSSRAEVNGGDEAAARPLSAYSTSLS